MKYLSLFLLFLASISLTGCVKQPEKQYSDLENHHVSTYFEAEHASKNRYVLYYYDSTDENDNSIKNEIISFFELFEALEYFLLDASQSTVGVSAFGEYDDEPLIYVVSNQSVLEEYIGESNIRSFISSYSDIEFDYDLFEDQHLDSIYDALEIENDSYILYYYLDNCPYCIQMKPHFLPWAFSKSAEDIYFINGAEVESPDTLPTDLIVLQSGTPIIVVMSNGEFANEYYSGPDDVMEYIERVGEDPITSPLVDLDYGDFSDYIISDLDETLLLSDGIYIEYYYSPNCFYCNEVKTDILRFLFTVENLDYYLINMSGASGRVKIDNYIGTPSLYVIYENQVLLSFIGKLNVLKFISDYNDGTLDFSSYQ